MSTPSLPVDQDQSSQVDNPSLLTLPQGTDNMAQSPAKKPEYNIKKIEGPTLTIAVGPSKELFHVHESIIRTSSPFFDKAMSGPWQESKQQIFQLPEDDPRIFPLYLHWIYFAKIPRLIGYAASKEELKTASSQYHDLAKAYVLGDKLLDVNFQNAAIDAIVDTRYAFLGGFYCLPSEETINFAYETTTECAKIRKLFVELYVKGATVGSLSEELPRQFLFAVAQVLVNRRPVIQKRTKATDYYIR